MAPIEPVALDAALARRHADMTTHAAVRRAGVAADDLTQLNSECISLGREQPGPNLPLNHAPITIEVFIDSGPDKHAQRRQA
jgi:hypothetical protein